jgi:SagB-type dehydrogenase family enzyme
MSAANSSVWWFHAAAGYYPAAGQLRVGGRSMPSDALSLPASDLPPSLAKMFSKRVSCRKFSVKHLTADDLGAMLHSGYGVLGKAVVNDVEFDHRPVPSAGATYSMQIFVLVRSVAGAEAGTYRYDPPTRRLNPVGARPDDAVIAEIFLGQRYVASASAIIVIASELGKALQRYGDRGYRYALFEAGHVAQNIALCAAATGVGNLQTGGFLDSHLASLLQIDPAAVVPLYAAAVGYPASEDPIVVRSLE